MSKISVAICTYNGEKFLPEQLNSILNQTVPVDEIIICDDQSTDSTIEILKTYAKNNSNIFTLFFNKVRLGAIKNFEKAISKTTGDLIFLSDQDDIWKENKVEITLDYFINVNKFKLLFTNGDLINEKGDNLNSTLWDEWGFTKDVRKQWTENKIAYKDLVLNKNKITGATICINKSIKKKVIPILTPSGYWQDVWLGLHAAAEDSLFFFEKSLIYYRIHGNQQIGISNNINSNNKPKGYVSLNAFYSRLKRLYPEKAYLLPEFTEKLPHFSFLNNFKLKLIIILKKIKIAIKH